MILFQLIVTFNRSLTELGLGAGIANRLEGSPFRFFKRRNRGRNVETAQTNHYGFSGTIRGIVLWDLVQLACIAPVDRMFHVESGTKRGTIYVRSGQVIHVEAEGQSGENALMSLLHWKDGRFEAMPLDESLVPEATINTPWEFLLIEATRLGDESSRGRATLHSFDGTIGDMQLADLVQMMCLARETRLITMESGKIRGKIHTSSGRIIDASTSEGIEGEEAFHLIIGWKEGTFEMLPTPEDHPTTIERGWEALLVEAIRRREAKSEVTEEEEEQRKASLAQKIQKMKVAQKIQLAVKGDKEARNILMRDSNRMVQIAIINNPRLTEGEVVMIAQSKSIDEEVLRRIAASREWLKQYRVRLALCTNPKTPVAISTKLVTTLMPTDVKLISKSKSVPTIVAQAARRMLTKKE